MAKKRTTLDALLGSTPVKADEPDEAAKTENTAQKSRIETGNAKQPVPEAKTDATVEAKSEIVKQTVYLPAAVHEQLRLLAFEERRKMHDYLVEGLDRVFKDRGLKPFDRLTNAKK